MGHAPWCWNIYQHVPEQNHPMIVMIWSRLLNGSLTHRIHGAGIYANI